MRAAHSFASAAGQRTPEPQRFNAHSLGCYPDHASQQLLPECEEDRDLYTNSAQRQRDAPRLADRDDTVGFEKLDGGGPHTPPTVCRHSWLHLQAHRDPNTEGDGPRNFYVQAGGDLLFQPSPTSYAPSAEGNLNGRAGRSLSCPSANRSLAPARYSAGYNMRGSLGRHTTLLANTSVHTSHLQDTPTSRSSATAAANALFGMARPTILMHAATPPRYAYEGGRPARPAHHLDEHGGVDFRSSVEALMGTQQARQESMQLDASVPRLTRFSVGSYGECSPGVKTTLGRPTMLRRPDAVFSADEEGCWDDSREGEDVWMGGATQVWRSSAEPPGDGAAVAAGGHGVYEEDVMQQQQQQQMQRQQLFSPCPQESWPPHPLSCPPSLAATAVEGHEKAPPMTQTMDEEGTVVQQQLSVGPAVQNSSLTGLEDAPRKSYVRSAANSPSQTEKGNVPRAEDSSGGVPEDVSAPARPLPSVTAETPSGEIAFIASGGGLPLPSCNTLPTQEWSYSAFPAQGPRLATESTTAPITTPCRPSLVQRTQHHLAGDANKTAMMADAVAVQLAHLSLHASPTQKRLAFEDDDDDGVDSTGSDAADRQAAVAMNGPLSPALPPLLAHGVAAQRVNGRGGARAANASLPASGHRGGCLSGLQLLRSRKRCLEEMQATDHEASASCTATEGMAAGTFAPQSRRASITPVQEELKRQKREEQRYQRQQNLLPADENGDDLVPAPMRTGAAPSVQRSASAQPALSSDVSSQGTGGGLQQQQQQFVRGAARTGDNMPWSQLSSISHASPASQSLSIGFGGVLSYSSLSQQRDGVAAAAVGASGCVSSLSSSCSQVLSVLPTNVTQRYPGGKV